MKVTNKLDYNIAMSRQLDTIGRSVYINFGRRATDVPAKIDTGADSSSVWASNIRVDKDGVLKFALFGKGSPYYNGKIFKRTDFTVAMVRSSSGHEQIRYRTHFTVTIKGRKIKALFNLSDRSGNLYPVLIGRRTVAGKFLVDVREGDAVYRYKYATDNKVLNKELAKNPHKFYKKYHKSKDK